MSRNLSDLIADRFGVRTEAAIGRTATTVGTTAVDILRNDPRRVAATIINLGAVAIYVTPDGAPSATRGIRLGANGGSMTIEWEHDFDLVGWAWSAIADAAATPLLIIEVLVRPGPRTVVD